MEKQQWIKEAKERVGNVTIESSGLFDSLLELRPDLNKSDIAEILGVKQITDYTGRRKAMPSLKVAVKAAMLLNRDADLTPFLKCEKV